MEGLRAGIKTRLEAAAITDINRVFDYGSTELCLDNLEQEKFEYAAIGLGDGRENAGGLTPTREQHFVEVDLLLFMKGQKNHARADEFTLAIRQALWEQEFSLDTIVQGQVDDVLAFTRLTDTISFSTLVYRCLLYEATT